MRVGSLFSGIEAASAAWLPLGWSCAWVAEIDPFASAVLKRRYPGTPNLGDVNEIEPGAVEPVDLVVFGSPCQSFSIAGKRLGLDDPRGNMALVGLRIIGKLRPRWVVWENVPGILSSGAGRDFGTFLGLLGELGYGFAYRVLDAQHFGVPQRRRRVFVVGYLGDWRGPAAVLFEPESLRGDPAPRREAGERIAPSLTVGAHGSSRHQYRQRGNEDALIARCVATGSNAQRYDYKTETLIAFSAKDHGGDCGDIAPTLRAGPHDKSHANAGVMPAVAFQANAGRDFTADEDLSPPLRNEGIGGVGGVAIAGHFEQNSMGGRGTLGWNDGDQPLRPVKPQGDHQMLVTHALDSYSAGRATEDGTGRGTPPVAVPIQSVQAVREKKQNGIGIGADGDEMFTLTGRDQHAVAFDPTSRQPEWSIDPPLKTDGPLAAVSGMSVRRLMPVECERLQGFPDGWTDVPYRGKPAADGPRYRAIGNSMAVPVVRWIGERIQQFEDSRTEVADAAD